jgi:hypothetical protein
MLERHNADPGYFRSTVLDNFPELSGYANMFSLWQLRGNKTELVPLSAQINNAMALCRMKDELNRSCVYIRPIVSLLKVQLFLILLIYQSEYDAISG